jgi:hypothetical protein
MSSLRKTALAAGALYLITFVTSIPARVLFGPVRNDPNYILGSGAADTQVLFAGLLDVLLAFSCIGTAVALYPVVKRQNQGIALGFVGSRTLEAAIIMIGAVALLSVVTMRQAGAGAEALGTSHALVAMYNWTFLFGPGFMAVVNAFLLGSLMYRSGLVPRIIPLVGLIGAPLLFASDLAVLFGLWTQMSLPAGIATVPIALWEVSLGVYLVAKGFRPSLHHGRNGRRRIPAGLPGRHRLVVADIAGPDKGSACRGRSSTAPSSSPRSPSSATTAVSPEARSAGQTADASLDLLRVTQMGRTLSACAPFGPWVVSNSTRCPSSSDR